MSLNALDVKQLVSELFMIVSGGKVEKIYQHSKEDLIISIYKSKTKYNLYFSLKTGIIGLYLLNDKLKAMEQPSSFIMYMRKYLKNSIINNITQINDDRFVEIEFKIRDNLFYIIAQLIDRSPNVIFLSGNRKVLGYIKPEKNLKKGKVFEIPFKSEMDINDLDLSFDIIDNMLYNEVVAEKYQPKAIKKEKSTLKTILTTPIKKEIKKIKRFIKNIESDLEKLEDDKYLIKSGQLLQTNFYRLKKGMDKIAVEDYEQTDSDGVSKTIEIKLSSKLTPQENVERYYKKSKKVKSAKEIIPKKISEAKSKLKALELLYNKLSTIEEIDEALGEIKNIKSESPVYYHKYLEGVHNSILNDRLADGLKKSASSSQNRTPFRYFISSNGRKIFVARNNRENEELTFQFAKGNDDWIHTQNYPGSHVLIPVGKNEKIDDKTLLEAFQLALHFSKAKNNKSADLYYTKRKYISKPKNAPTGKVNISNYKTINVIFNEKILHRILGNKIE